MDKVICRSYNNDSLIEYIGQIVSSTKYDPPNSIRMSTNIIDFPYRVIMDKMIISINGINHIPTKIQDSVRVVKGSNGTEYTITGNRCSCPGFQFRKTCKHIK